MRKQTELQHLSAVFHVIFKRCTGPLLATIIIEDALMKKNYQIDWNGLVKNPDYMRLSAKLKSLYAE
jgi:hypothetical protein